MLFVSRDYLAVMLVIVAIPFFAVSYCHIYRQHHPIVDYARMTLVIVVQTRFRPLFCLYKCVTSAIVDLYYFGSQPVRRS